MIALVIVVAMASSVAAVETVANVDAPLEPPTLQDLAKFLSLPLEGVNALQPSQQEQIIGALVTVILAIARLVFKRFLPFNNVLGRYSVRPAQGPKSARVLVRQLYYGMQLSAYKYRNKC